MVKVGQTLSYPADDHDVYHDDDVCDIDDDRIANGGKVNNVGFGSDGDVCDKDDDQIVDGWIEGQQCG